MIIPSQTAIVIYCKLVQFWEHSAFLPAMIQLGTWPTIITLQLVQKTGIHHPDVPPVGWQANGDNTGQIKSCFSFSACLTCTATYSTGLVKPHSKYYYPANSRPLGESLARRILARSKQALRNVLEWADQASFSHAGTLENHPWCLAWEDACT